jgi:hypothetical protein
MPVGVCWLAGVVTAAGILAWPTLQAPAQAGLLLPVLQLMRPKLETKLTKLCVDTASGGQATLEAKLLEPCQQLAKPTSVCLVEETDATGQGLEVLADVLRGSFGIASESVVKRCLAKMLGLPADSLKEVPLRELAQTFNKVRP